MKNFLKKAGLAMAMTVLAFAIHAQEFAYLNSAAVLASMPEMKKAESTLKVTQKQFQEKGKKMIEELQTEYQEVQKKVQAGAMSPKEQEKVAKELQDKEKDIAAFEQQMNEKVSAKRNELLNPILEKVNIAIQELAKENNYKFVFDASPGTGILLYADASLDITLDVMKKLGIEPKQPVPALEGVESPDDSN